MPLVKVNHYQSSWPDTIDQFGGELIRDSASEVYIEREQRTERQTDYAHRMPSPSRSMPRRSTEIPGWYKQIYAEMGNPQSIAPHLIKSTRSNSRSLVDGCENNRHIDRLFNRPTGLVFRSHTSNSYESESSSRSSTRESSMSPTNNQKIYSTEKNIFVGGVVENEESLGERQEYYPYRDAHHGKPLPGENGFTIDSLPTNVNLAGRRRESRSLSTSLDSGSQSQQQYQHEPPRYVSKSPPARFKNHSSSQSSSSPLSLSRSQLSRISSLNRRSIPSSSNKPMKKEPPIYRKSSFQLTPLPEYFSRLRHIKVTSIPNPIPPKFGTLTQGGRWPDEAQGPTDVGPPCQLCKKPITEPRFIHHDQSIYHCCHFTCSHCSTILRHDDFRMTRKGKPYCYNCFKRQNL